jgi:DNA-binding CsgD family transcriptional regulator
MDQTALVAPEALLEREHEVERIRGAVRAVGQQAGAALIVEGAAGIGKSRLLDVARERASQLGLRVLTARATELEQGFPFGVARQLFERTILEANVDERERWLAGAAALAAEVLTAAPASDSDAAMLGPASGDSGYAWMHGLYWLASNLSADSPLMLVVDDLQWCDAPSARALGFIARRLEGQPLGVILATRPLDPTLTPEAAALVADHAADLLRPAALTLGAVRSLIVARLSDQPHDRFLDACIEVTGGNPFLLGELLAEAVARDFEPTAAAATDIRAIVPRGVANAVLLRLARLAPTATALARALSVLGDGAHVGDAAQLAGLDSADLEAAMAALVSAGVVESGGRVRFTHPIMRSAIYDDLLPPERERLHHAAAEILRKRGAPLGQVAAHVMHTEPAGDPAAVALLRESAREALALGDASRAAALLGRALDEPPDNADRDGALLELGLARARTGAPGAVSPLAAIVEQSEDPSAIAAAANELAGMFLYAGRAAEGAAVLRRAHDRLLPGSPEHEQLQAAVLGLSYVSASARRDTDAVISSLREPDRSARGTLAAQTLATLAMDEVMYLRSASRTIDLAERALAAGLPVEPRRSADWAILALGSLALADRGDIAQPVVDGILARARELGAALTVAVMSALRALIAFRRGDLVLAAADASAAIELAPELLGSEFVLLLAVPAAVVVGLEREESPQRLRELIERTDLPQDTDFLASSHVRYVSGLLRAAAGNHAAATEELRGCAGDHPTFGGENPTVLPWRSASALPLAELGRYDEARSLAAEEVRRAQSFGAPRAIGIALRAQALVGPPADRSEGLSAALGVLARSPARLEHARVLVDIGAGLRAAGQRKAAREPLLEALALAGRCGAKALERRSRAELAAIGVRPRTTERAGTDSLTPSERRIVELAAAGSTNREIAQALFITEKTVETHLGRAFRKLDVSSRRQLADVLARAAG